MKLNKGLHTDNNKEIQPDGTWRDAQNMMYLDSKHALTNEKGWKSLNTNLPANSTIIGSQEVLDGIILFLYNTTSSSNQIGKLYKSGNYETLLSGSNFNFNLYYPVITKLINDNIIVFTDFLNPIRFINLNNIPSTVNSKTVDLLGLTSTDTLFDLDYINGGNIPEGSYSVYFRYVNSNGVSTNYINTGSNNIVCSSLTYSGNGIISEAGSNSDSSGKSIKISFTDLDTDYELIEIVIIGKTNDLIIGKKVASKQINSSSDEFIISEFEGEEIDITEILTYSKNFRVKDIEIFENDLFGVNVRQDNEINYQQYANNIVVNISTSLVDPKLPSITSIKRGFNLSLQSFCPGEVYALYITLVLNDNTETRAFHIPGRKSQSGETGAATFPNSFYKSYQTEETSYNGSAVGNDNSTIVKMGYWENENEVYPNTDEFSTSDTGDLRGTNVRHHKIPSLHAIKTNDYSTSTTFGITELPIITLSFTNIKIPNEIANKIKGFKVYAAKRDISNMTILGFSPSLLGGQMNNPSDAFSNNRYVPITCNMDIHNGSISGTDEAITPNVTKFKAHCFDLMLNRPKINPSYIVREAGVELDLSGSGSYSTFTSVSEQLSNDSVSGSTPKRFSFHNHMGTNSSVTTSQLGTGVVVKSYKYLPANSILPSFFNRNGENVLVLELDSSSLTKITGNATVQNLDGGTLTEYSGLHSIRQGLIDVYGSFYERSEFINLGFKPINFTNGTYSFSTNNGDIRLTINNVISTAPTHGSKFDKDSDGDYEGIGCMSVRNFITYSINDCLAQRESTVQNGQNFLKSTDAYSILDAYDPTVDKVYDINSNLKYLDETNSIIPFNSYEIFENDFPNRIIRFIGVDQELTSKINLNYLPNNYFELERSKGKINSINRLGDKLIIGCDRGRFHTRPKQSLQLTGLQVYIGTNDIFDIEPKILLDTEGNNLACTSRFHTLVTDKGAILVDEPNGRIYLYNGETLNNISDLGMKNYFRTYLPFNKGKYDIITYSSVLVGNSNGKLYVRISASSHSRYEFRKNEFVFLENIIQPVKIIKIISDDIYIYLHTDYDYATSTITNVHHYSESDSISNERIILGYDNLNERFLITKKENKFTSDRSRYRGFYFSSFVTMGYPEYDENDIIRYEDTLKYKHYSNTLVDLIGETLNITLSFHLEKGFWVSHHSYKPVQYILFQSDLLSYNGSELYRFGSPDRGLVYGTIEDCSVTVIFNQPIEIIKKYKQIIWDIPFYLTDDYTENITFDSIELNTNQYSLPNVKTLSQYVDTTNQGNVRNVHDKWHFNDIRYSGNRMFDKFLQIKFNFDNDVSSNNKYYFYIQEILTIFNYVKK